IKPANVFIDQHGNWILGDPGIAYRDDGADETTTRPVSKDWFPRWYDDELGHTALADIYMLGAVGFYLLTDQGKPLDPSYIRKPRFDLPKLYPLAAGVQETYDLLCSIVKSEPSEIPFTDGAQLAGALRKLLPAVENSEIHQLRSELRRTR